MSDCCPQVSVIIPTHNRGKTIARAVESVLAQTFEDIEVIVVDDASTDDTKEIVDGLDDPRVVYLQHDTNKGACVARNTGIANARAELIAFQDSDDEWIPEKLERQLALINAGGDAPKVIYCGFVRHSVEQSDYVPDPRIRHRRGHILGQLLAGNFVSTQTLLVPRECFDRVGGFLPELRRLQDWELAIRLSDHYEFDLVDEPLVKVQTTPGSISDDPLAFIESMEFLLDRHKSRFARFPVSEAKARCFLAHYLLIHGMAKESRFQLRQVYKLRKSRVPASILWALSFLGQNAYRIVVGNLSTLPRD